jgi:hypothetical protein
VGQQRIWSGLEAARRFGRARIVQVETRRQRKRDGLSRVDRAAVAAATAEAGACWVMLAWPTPRDPSSRSSLPPRFGSAATLRVVMTKTRCAFRSVNSWSRCRASAPAPQWIVRGLA